MVNKIAFNADMKMIRRDPILIIFMCIPFLAGLLIKGILHYLVPWLWQRNGFDVTLYYAYILGGVFLMSPMMLGTVAGFLMIDEKDGKIFELISITPVGYNGYMIHRLMLPVIGSAIYTLVMYWLLDIFFLRIETLLILMIFMGLESIMIGTLLFVFAKDKVQGLTYSKGMGVFMVLAMADLFGKPWLSTVAGAIPFYWVIRVIRYPDNIVDVVMAFVVHLVWLMVILRRKL